MGTRTLDDGTKQYLFLIHPQSKTVFSDLLNSSSEENRETFHALALSSAMVINFSKFRARDIYGKGKFRERNRTCEDEHANTEFLDVSPQKMLVML